jgi:dihydroneopterin aldolase
VWQAVRDAVEGEPVNLIETLAERVARTVLDRFAIVESVWVRVEKPGAPVAGAAAGLVAVEITRDREVGADQT